MHFGPWVSSERSSIFSRGVESTSYCRVTGNMTIVGTETLFRLFATKQAFLHLDDKRTAMKIARARVENKRLAPSLAIFMLGSAPKAHEVLPEKCVLDLSLVL